MALVVSNMGFKKHRKSQGFWEFMTISVEEHRDFGRYWLVLTIFCWMSAMVGGTNSLAEAQIRVVTTFGEEIVPWSKPGQVRVFGIRVFFLEMGLRWNWSLVLSVTFVEGEACCKFWLGLVAGPPENGKGLAEQVQKGPFRKRAAAFQMVIGHSLETAWHPTTAPESSRRCWAAPRPLHGP